MKEKFPFVCSESQSATIVELLGPGFSSNHEYKMNDIFVHLPHSITYNGHRGDLCVSTVDIAYFSIDGEWKHVLVHHEPIPIGGDIFDAFIAMLRWLKDNDLM